MKLTIKKGDVFRYGHGILLMVLEYDPEKNSYLAYGPEVNHVKLEGSFFEVTCKKVTDEDIIRAKFPNHMVYR